MCGGVCELEGNAQNLRVTVFEGYAVGVARDVARPSPRPRGDLNSRAGATHSYTLEGGTAPRWDGFLLQHPCVGTDVERSCVAVATKTRIVVSNKFPQPPNPKSISKSLKFFDHSGIA